MRDNKQLPFCPVAIKQEPRDLPDVGVTDDNYISGGYNNHPRHSAVDLRCSVSSSREADDGFRQTTSVDSVTELGTPRTSDVNSRHSDVMSRHSDVMSRPIDFASRPSGVSPRLPGRERSAGYDLSPNHSSRGSAAVSVSSPSLAEDLKNHIMGLAAAAASRDAFPTGKSSWREAAAGSGDCTCTDCGARFESSRAYRAHRLTRHILSASDRGEERPSASMPVLSPPPKGGGDRTDIDDDAAHGSSFSGLALASDGSGFVCEECKAHFTSRDTYAMHMLLRAKNEACFPCRGKTTTTATPTTSRTIPLTASPGLSSGVSSSGNRSPKDVKTEPRSELSRSDGLLIEASSRHKLPDPSKLGHELLADAARAADYSAAWWSKYMPWMGIGVSGGAGGGGGGVVMGAEPDSVGPPLPMICYMCGEIFTNRDSLAMHVLFHTRDMPTTVPDTHSSWIKPLNSSALLSASQAGMPLHQSGFNGHNSTAASYNGHRQEPLSPTEAAVASAVAAAAAAVTSVSSSLSSSKSPSFRLEQSRSDEKTESNAGSNSNGILKDKSEERDSNKWTREHEIRRPASARGGPFTGHTGPMLGRDPFARFTPDPILPKAAKIFTHSSSYEKTPGVIPGRGNSAPALGSHTPLGLESECSRSGKPVDKPRPMSADHVQTTDKSARFSNGVMDPGVRSVTPCYVSIDGESKVDPITADSRITSDSLLHRNSFSLTNLYRLQRLKRLRMLKTPYRRPATRGRPPMTIYGTASRRHNGLGLHNTVSSHTSAFSQTASPAPLRLDTVTNSVPTLTPSSTPTPAATPPASGGSRRMAAMLQLLTSHGHDVCACVHCEVIFADRTLYQLHMGLHNVNNPWQCNACGHVSTSRLHFATHTLHY